MRNLCVCGFVLLALSTSSFAQSAAGLYFTKGKKISFHTFNEKDREINFKEIFTDSIHIKNGDTTSYFWSRVYVWRGIKREAWPGKFKSDPRIGMKKNSEGFYLNYAALASGEDNNSRRTITVDIIEDQFLFYPKNMSVGQSIEGTIDVSGKTAYYQSESSADFGARVQGREFGQATTSYSKVYVRVMDRKVTGKEKIKIGDKMVDCFIIEHTVTSAAKKDGNYKAEAKVKEWYAPDYGLVQWEKYNNKEKLEAKSKLLSL